MRTIKVETQVKKQMVSYVGTYGKADTKTITPDGTKLQIVAPNRFGGGYILMVLPNGEVWSADFSTRTGSITTPRKQHPGVLLRPWGAQ